MTGHRDRGAADAATAGDRRAVGAWGEELAAGYLEERGLTVINRNFRCPAGEIDIIARDGDCLVFCEVKTRRGQRCGSPLESVHAAKQRRLIRLASWYIAAESWTGAVRFDVVGVSLSGPERARVEWLPDAFAVG
ncbi:MAG: YraN family protein [Deltaproteobacteria bacterium]|nr:YraN family protein [Candidatus Anaeroferrophillacea bacterium]